MKLLLYATLLSVCSTITLSHATEDKTDLGNVTGGYFKNAHAIIDKKCTACHSRAKIDLALSSGKNLEVIQKAMESKGVRLSSKEQEVLGIFWKQSKPVSPK